MANLSNINNKLLVGTNGEVRIGDTATVADVKLRVKQTAQQWTAQFVNTDSSVAYGISIDTSASSYGVAGTLQCYTNSGGGFIVRNDSKVGIGTDSPDGNLEVITSAVVSGVSDTVNNVLIGLQSANRPTIILDTADTTYTNRTWNITNVGSAGKLFIGRNGLDVMVMDNTGNVGIGTDVPTQGKVDILDAGAYSAHTGHGLTINSNASNAYTSMYMGADDTIDAIYIQSAGRNTSFTTKKLLLNPNGGNVGIGTDSPSSKLSVFGTQAAIDFQRGTGDSKWEFSSDGARFYIAEMSTGTRDYIMALEETTGNVGIGVTGPSAKLDVYAAQGGMGAYFFTNHNSAVSDGHVYINSDQVLAPFTALKVRQAGTGPILQLTGTAAVGEALRVTSGGRVGIGTTLPESLLHIKGETRAYISFQDTTDGYFGFVGDATNMLTSGTVDNLGLRGEAGIQFGVSDVIKMVLDSSGNVGIGGSPNNFTNQKSLTINGIPGGNSRLDFQINGTNEAEIVANDASLIIAHNDILKFYTANADRMRIDSSGNLLLGNGVGNPYLAFLSAGGNGGNERARMFGYADGGTYGGGLKLQTRDNSNIFNDALVIDRSGNAVIKGKIESVKELVNINSANGIRSAGLESDSTGNIWLGTGTTAATINFVTGNSTNGNPSVNGVKRLTTNREGTDVYASYAGNTFPFRVGYLNGSTYTPTFVVDDNSNVGIGTSDPVTKLELKSLTVGSITNDRETTTSAFVINGSNENMSLQFGLGNSALNYGNWIQSGYDNGTPGSSPLYLNPIGGNVGIGTDLPTQKLDVDGQMTHGGLVLKTGTSVYIDTIQTINKTLSITGATWTNTGIEGTDIGANGSYMIQVYSNAHGSTGGAWYSMYWTGVMSWYKDSANGINASEIYLNFSGHALNSNVLQLRTVQHTASGSPANLMSLEIKTSNTLTNAPISFRFRRLM